MSIRRWFRLHEARQERALRRRLRQATRNLKQARASLAAAREYTPQDLGGVEDRMDWEDQARNSIWYWTKEQGRLMKQLNFYFPVRTAKAN